MADIQDFGEKIGGARKDLWSLRGLDIDDMTGMNEAERKKYVKKDNVWKRPDYNKMMADGMSPRVAYFIKSVRDSLPTGPYIRRTYGPEETQAAQENYISFIGKMRDAAMSLKEDKDIAGFFDRTIRTYLHKDPGSYYAQVDPSVNGLIDRKVMSIQHMESLSRLDRAIKLKEFGYSPEQKVLSKYEFFQYDGETAKFGADRGRNRLEIKTRGGYYFGYPDGKMADPNNWEKGTWFALCHGVVVLNNAPDKETLQKAVLAAEQAVPTTKAGKERKTRFVPPQLEHIRFTGMDVRDGRHMTGQNYMDTFGFRGGEYGNWMNEKDRQASLDMGYESLYAMAKALNISLEDISLGGKLAIAFGARGQGAAAAHYEPLREVINLTKMHGAGSLAHEWGHAMDDILNKQIGGSTLTDDRRRGLTDLQQQLHEHMKYVQVEQSAESVREGLQFRLERSERSTDRLLHTWMPGDDKLSPEQVTQRDQLIAAVLADRSITSMMYNWPGIDAPASVEALSDFRKAVTGHVLNKDVRRMIAQSMGQVNQLRTSIDQAAPRMVQEKSQYYQDSVKFDDAFSKSGHGYWQSEIEMFARAFACYTHDKLTEAGIRCDYAVGHSESGPVPKGEERKRLNQDFDALLGEFRSRGLLHEFTEPERVKAVQREAPAETHEPVAYSEDASGQFTLDALIADAESRAGTPAAGKGRDIGR